MTITKVRDLTAIAGVVLVGFAAGVVAEDLLRGPARKVSL